MMLLKSFAGPVRGISCLCAPVSRSYHSRRQARRIAFVGKKADAMRGNVFTPEAASPEPLVFQATHVPAFTLPNGWTPPPESPPDLPFFIQRTGTGKCLPVYSSYKNANTRVITVLRQVDGDVKMLQQELAKVCGVPVAQKPGRLEVKGHHVNAVREWLVGLGF
eukprot:CAMPEP_0172589958 /NCGR_PEP_ID=MMETSP1068-20121228/8472_1 /TAXON_ID=35684 /ORGANISM="Pseudopedinella elastica, Strain CCMP716" /LENGTH=163 /DNA_ID=CAMNT_0013385631 /DNA_START=78 /DNA_END=569 /DNA_ORIENTATION=+